MICNIHILVRIKCWTSKIQHRNYCNVYLLLFHSMRPKPCFPTIRYTKGILIKYVHIYRPFWPSSDLVIVKSSCKCNNIHCWMYLAIIETKWLLLKTHYLALCLFCLIMLNHCQLNIDCCLVNIDLFYWKKWAVRKGFTMANLLRQKNSVNPGKNCLLIQWRNYLMQPKNVCNTTEKIWMRKNKR